MKKKITIDQCKVLKNRLYRLFRFYWAIGYTWVLRNGFTWRSDRGIVFDIVPGSTWDGFCLTLSVFVYQLDRHIIENLRHASTICYSNKMCSLYRLMFAFSPFRECAICHTFEATWAYSSLLIWEGINFFLRLVAHDYCNGIKPFFALP